MSNQVNRIAKDLAAKAKYNNYMLENTTAGTLILTAAMLSGKSDIDCFNVFQEAQKREFATLKEFADYITTEIFNVPEDYKKHLVLITDPYNLHTPVVTAEVELDGNQIYLPVGRNSYIPAVFRCKEKEVEYIYEEE